MCGEPENKLAEAEESDVQIFMSGIKYKYEPTAFLFDKYLREFRFVRQSEVKKDPERYVIPK